MNRREWLKGLTAFSLLTRGAFSQKSIKSNLIKPKRLTRGDTIGLIAPAGGLTNSAFDKALQNISDLGFRVKIGKHARGKRGFLSGTDRERLDDLHWAFGDQDVKAVWCVRGGYGVTRLLPDVNYKLIRKNPKIFIGYSDITALHLAISQNCSLVTFHGPVAASTFSDYSKNNVLNVLLNPSVPYKIEISPDNAAKESNLYKTEVIASGKCRGRLVGGNLSLLSSLAGTPFALRGLKNKLLFLEDVSEQPYRIDRMLTQLKQSVDLGQLAGIALGVFEDCNPKDAASSQSLTEVLKDRLGNLGIPVIYGLSFGHIRDQFTLPVGIEAELDTANAALTFLETGVV